MREKYPHATFTQSDEQMTIGHQPQDFSDAAKYVLKKNADLYRRLASSRSPRWHMADFVPISESEIVSLIAEDESCLSPQARRLWELLRIPPVKWNLPPWSDMGGGFWVVGVFGERVVWYNDIEDGFNVSRFFVHGVIAEYWCNQDELQHTMNCLLRLIETGDPTF